MKKIMNLFFTLLLTFGMAALAGCSSRQEDPGPPPAEVLNPDNVPSEGQSAEDGDQTEAVADNETSDTGDILEDVVSVRIGRDGRKEWSITMYNNDAANTMLDYLSDSGLLFPTYTYEEEQGFVAQNIRGSYSRDDEVEIKDIKVGELYLFSGGQLRFYFKDMEGANITATPVGYYTDTENLTETVQEAYTSNLDDSWGVDVYFWITKNLQ